MAKNKKNDKSSGAEERLARLREIIGIMEQSSLTELSYEDVDINVYLQRDVPMPTTDEISD